MWYFLSSWLGRTHCAAPKFIITEKNRLLLQRYSWAFTRRKAVLPRQTQMHLLVMLRLQMQSSSVLLPQGSVNKQQVGTHINCQYRTNVQSTLRMHSWWHLRSNTLSHNPVFTKLLSSPVSLQFYWNYSIKHFLFSNNTQYLHRNINCTCWYTWAVFPIP